MSAAISKGRALYVLAILSLVTMLNYLDRNLISILVEDLKRDLQLSDGQIGILSGMAFALVYSLAAIPIARYADGGRRVRTLVISMVFWSTMTAVCGLTGSFTALLFARFGVGLGEAGGAPTIHAIVAETFSTRFRGTALGVIGASGGLGLALAFSAGGWMAQHHGWRSAFLLACVPGLVLAVLLALTVREPQSAGRHGPIQSPRFGEAMRTLARRKSFVWTCAGLSIAGIGAFGSFAWTPAFLMRHYGLGASEVGTAYGAATGPATVIGVLLGGVVSDWLGRRDARWPLWILSFSFAITLPLFAVFRYLDNFALAMSLTLPLTLIGIIWTAPAYLLIQNLAGARLRATGAALFMLVVNIIGQGLGPILVGYISDVLTPHVGRAALGDALLITSSTYLVGVACFLIATRTLKADLADAAADAA